LIYPSLTKPTIRAELNGRGDRGNFYWRASMT